VLASSELVTALALDSGITSRRIGTRRIRDIGRVEIFRLGRG
jgi:hypothetical protein